MKYISFFILISILSFTIFNCSKTKNFNVLEYRSEIQEWQKKRNDRLKLPDSWLTLTGLFWLTEGENKMGADSSNKVIFPQGRTLNYIGSIYLDNGNMHLKAAKDVKITVNDSLVTEIQLLSDGDGKANPTIMKHESFTFYIIKRGEQVGVRLKDNKNPSFLNFKGLEYFEINPDWRFEADFIPYIPPKIIPIVNILNQVNNDTCTGAISFEVDGKIHELDALKDGNNLFIIFNDLTSGKETYGMGRYLYTSLPDSENIVVLDFNKSYNPPCVFSEFATCPLPPEQNYLNLRIEAGEKKYTEYKH